MDATNKSGQAEATASQQETVQTQEKPRRSRVWLVVIALLFLAILAVVVVQGIFLYGIYTEVSETSRSLADEIMALASSPNVGSRSGALDPGAAEQQQESLSESLDMLSDMLASAQQGEGGQPGQAQNLQNLLGGLLGQEVTPGGDQSISTPSADIYLEDGQYRILLNMPGIDTETVRIEAIDRILMITATVAGMLEGQQQAREIMRERHHQAYQRTITLPTAVNSGTLSWEYEKGILIVKVSQS